MASNAPHDPRSDHAREPSYGGGRGRTGRPGHDGAAHSGAGTCRVVLGITLGSCMVWIVWLSREEWDSPLVQWLVLKPDAWTFHTFFVHPFFHENVLHLIASVGALAWAGSRLEARWGALRFAAFWCFVNVGTSLVCVAAEGVARGSLAGTIVFGGAGAAFASLAAYAHVVEDGWTLRVVSNRYCVWIAIILGATGLVLLDSEREGGRVLLLPQISSVVFALIFLRILPIWDDLVLAWRMQRERAQEQRVREIRKRVDALLEKISMSGLESLSSEERAFLKQASKHYKSQR